MKINKIAVLITSFNRKETTLSCLKQLFNITNDVDVYLVDDDSPDGTFQSVKEDYPHVKLFRGNGNLYWNRGLYLAWEKASEFDYDYYLWLNDDVILYPNVISELLDSSHKKPKSLIVGIIESPDKSKIIYGGIDSSGIRILPSEVMKEVSLMNGNVVLIPRIVFKKVGNLDKKFHHDLGDIDYGLRSQKLGFKVYSTKIIIGSCQENDINRFRLKNSNIKERFQKLYSPTGANPRLLFYFHRRHYGILRAILYFFKINFNNILPDKINI